MTPQLAEALKTPEGRKKIASFMVVPIRCGGLDYIDGKPMYRLGGWLVPAEVVKQGWDAIHEYQRTHASYLTSSPKHRRRRGT